MLGKTVALYLSEGELGQRGWTGSELTREQALALTRERIGGGVDRVEVYAACRGVLLIAHQKISRPPTVRPLRRGRVRRFR